MATKANGQIAKTKGICGGRARIAGTRIPMWGLASAKQIGLTDKQILDRYPVLSAEQLESAWEYFAAHREEIDRQISENQEC